MLCDPSSLNYAISRFAIMDRSRSDFATGWHVDLPGWLAGWYARICDLPCPPSDLSNIHRSSAILGWRDADSALNIER